MSKVKKLTLYGIRNFSPFDEHNQTIRFEPVTLLLGQNGSGKTTVIEALCYAISGQFPGGSNRGQNWINDPKLTQRMLTRACIKLELANSSGDCLKVVRVMEVEQKRDKLQFSAKEHTLKLIKANGDQQDISSRCIDINLQCCQFLNVSPAIMSLVIFCHQENSSWPLDENKAVKENFDNIFNVHKYNKCADQFRKELKQIDTNLKVMREQMTARGDKYQAVQRERTRLDERTMQMQKLEKQVTELRDKLQPVQEQITNICQLEDELGQLHMEMAKYEEMLKGLHEQQQTLKKHIQEFDGDDEQLARSLKSFHADQQKEQSSIDTLVKQQASLETRLKNIAERIQEYQMNVGQLNEEKKQIDEKRKEFEGKLQSACAQFNIPTLKTSTDEQQMLKIIEAVKRQREKAEEQLSELKALRHKEQKALQTELDGVRENCFKLKYRESALVKEIKSNELKSDKLESEIRRAGENNELLSVYRTKLQTVESTMKTLKDKIKNDNIEGELNECKDRIAMSETQLLGLEREHRILMQNSVLEERIESENRTVMAKQRAVDDLLLKHLTNMKLIFGRKEDIPSENLRDAISKQQAKQQEYIQQMQVSIDEKKKEIMTKQAQIDTLKGRIKEIDIEVKNKQVEVRRVSASSDKDLRKVLEGVQQERERLSAIKGKYESTTILYETFIGEFQTQNPCCPVCQTDFQNKQSNVKAILRNLKEKIALVPNKLQQTNKKLQEVEQNYAKLQQLVPVQDDIQRLLTKDMPEVKAQLQKATADLKVLQEDLMHLQIEIREPMEMVTLCGQTVSDAAVIDQCMIDIEKSQSSEKSLRTQLSDCGVRTSRLECEAAIDTLKGKLAMDRQRQENLQQRLTTHHNHCQELTREKSALLEKQLEIEKSQQSRALIAAEVEALKKELIESNRQLLLLKDDIVKCEKQIKLLSAQKEEKVQDDQMEIANEEHCVKMVCKLTEEIDRLHGELNKTSETELEHHLAKCVECLDRCKLERQTVEADIEKIRSSVSDKRERLAKGESHYRMLQDNVTLREKRAESEKVQQKLSALKHRIGDYDYRSIKAKKQQLKVQQENLEVSINEFAGEERELKRTIDEIQSWLAQPDNVNALRDYKSKCYEYVLWEKAKKDIATYIPLLDNAVLQYHKNRMRDINKTIREYWRDIYRGNDIDYIEIQAQETKTTTTRRSYEYKVVQVKNGVELDMRGRCSAGQKVLACLIIRIALAETFSGNCGIFTLDEPTTNLDKENVQSLCAMLGRLIEIRSKEQNFQLIIITHDEEFLNELSHSSHCKHYYHLSRNAEGFSVITKEAI